MATPSPNSNSVSIITSNPLKNEQEGEVMVEERSMLRCRRPFNDANLEEKYSKYKERILALPKDESWLEFTLRKYKGFWNSERFLPGIMAMEEAFEPRPDDVLVASFPKSGTTWLKALTFTIVHRNKYAFQCHPLLELNSHDCVPMIEHNFGSQDEHYFDTLPSPRVYGTHVSYSMLPESIKTSKCRIVYICREPKDVLVSLWYMNTTNKFFHKKVSFTKDFELFCEGRTIYGPVWDHVREYYVSNLQSPNKILFLKYEEMMKDPISGVIRIANFIGYPFCDEEVKTDTVEKIVELCSFNKLRNLDVNKSGICEVQNDYFFRKAVVGDWRNHMTLEMAIKLDEITKERLLDFGLHFSSDNQ